ncbi:unnamed protein product [Prunus armeniaca]|uniref:Gag/pol protein n=1 Tax=Prunus armeniaca TaxID=36596 RepID=A0A6J5TIG8_PRUAR|nr:unnamed protein product [Prunus armeniaca]
MGKIEHTLSKLLNMCVTTEKTFKREGGNGIIVVFYKGSTSSTKPSNKGKGKSNASKKKKWNPELKPKGGVKKKQEEGKEVKGQCFHCRKDEPWKMNCRAYLASPKDNRAEGNVVAQTEKK